jgi:hypothetical protein
VTAVGRAALAILLWFGLDALLFRTGLYCEWTDPTSSTGSFEFLIRTELAAQKTPAANVVATIGDSRFGYLPRVANELAPETGYQFRHIGSAGGDARLFYYTLRTLDPTASRYRAVVIGVDDYDDLDTGVDPAADLRGLHMAIARLGLRDVAQVVSSYPDAASRWYAARGMLWRGFILQRDVREFLGDPAARAKMVRDYRSYGAIWLYDYDGEPQSMEGMSADWKERKLTFPPHFTAEQRRTAEDWLLSPRQEQTGALARFRRRWFGAILDHYRGSGTRIVFVRLARGPLVPPDWAEGKRSSSIREFARRPDVTLLDEHAFDSLERPELFRDALHLNREGAHRFSALLARAVREVLGPPR